MIRKGIFAVIKGGDVRHTGSLASCAQFVYNNGGKIGFISAPAVVDLTAEEKRQVKEWMDDAE